MWITLDKRKYFGQLYIHTILLLKLYRYYVKHKCISLTLL